MEEIDRRSFLRIGAGAALIVVAGCSSKAPERGRSVDPNTTHSTPPLPSTTEISVVTAEPQPTDVIEHRDGYDVLRNGGYKYEHSSVPWFGGFELHLKDGQQTYGFTPEGNAQEVVLNGLLDAFGGQHPEFRNPDGSVNRDAYKAYLESNNGRDTVSIPENISPQDNDISYPPVVASAPLQLDLSKDIVFVGGDFSFYDAEFADIQYYRHTPDSFTHAFMGVTTEGQLYIGVLTRNQQGITKNEFSSYDVSVALPTLFSVTANITSLNNADNPQLNWQQPFWNTIMPFGTIPGNLYTPGLTTSNVLDYGDFKTAESKIFSQV